MQRLNNFWRIKNKLDSGWDLTTEESREYRRLGKEWIRLHHSFHTPESDNEADRIRRLLDVERKMSCKSKSQKKSDASCVTKKRNPLSQLLE